MIVPCPILISPPEGSLKGVQLWGKEPLVVVGSAHIWRASNNAGAGAVVNVVGEGKMCRAVMAGNVFCFSTSSPSSRLVRGDAGRIFGAFR